MILIDGVVFSIQRSGGISVVFSELIKSLGDNDIPHNLLIYKNESKVLSEYELHYDMNPIRMNISIERFLDVPISSEVSVFHSSYYRLPKITLNVKPKIITTVHDFTYEKFVGGIKAKLHHEQKKRAILNSDVVVCISESTKSDMLDFIPECAEKEIHVIPNGVSEDYFVIDSYKGKYDNSVVFVGARGGYKNFNLLVEALATLDLTLTIIGGGELNKSETRLLESKIPNRYRKLDYVVNQELNEIYNKSLCLVYPSLYEGFGIPPIEAMRAGCPVIASNTSSLPEVCGDAAVLIDDINTIKLRNALKKVESEHVRKKLIEDGLLQSSKYSWQLTFKEVNDIYNR